MKRFLSALMLLCMTFLLCACPGGSPVEPPVSTPCTVCGNDPCTCEKPGGDPCPTCGKDPCECPPPALDITFGEGDAMAGTGDSLAEDAFCLTEHTYDEAGATPKPAARFFAQVNFDGKVYKASGDAACPLKSTKDKVYGSGKLTVLILPNGAELSLNEDLTFENLVIVGDVTVASGKDYLFKNVQFVGNVTVGADAQNVAFEGCRLTKLENAGTDTFLIDSCVSFAGVGIESSGAGLYIRGTRLEGTGTAISTTGADFELRNSTVKTDKDGIGVEIKDATNSLVALSVIRGTQKSVAVSHATNAVVVKNSLICVYSTGVTNIYVCDNAMGGRVVGEHNNYFLADGNTYPADDLDHRALSTGDRNVNGDTLQNVDARAEAGVLEELLPHTNKDLFVSMTRKDAVKEYGREKPRNAYNYIMDTAAAEDCVILAPGAYAIDITLQLRAEHNDTTIYAYGALVEGVKYEKESYNTSHIRVIEAKNIAIKGLAIGYAQQTCGQVYVLEKKGGYVTVVTGAGMINEFSYTGSAFFDDVSIGIQRAGTFYAIGDYFITAARKNSDGTMTITPNDAAYETIKKGDILTCRFAKSNTVVSTQKSSGILYQDMVQYGYAGGYAFQENSNLDAVTYYRIADTSKSGMVIDEATYDKYAAWEDKYGVDLEISIDELPNGQLRYRGSPGHISSIDATHSVKCAVGSRVISCLFETMCDDGTNQRANHARLSEVIDNKDGTTTIIYKANLSERTYGADGQNATIQSYCADFLKGDRVYIYTAAGQLVCDGLALEASHFHDKIPSTHPTVKQQDISRYAVTVKTEDVNTAPLADYNLKDDHHKEDQKVLVDNMSRATNGFHFENMMVQNVRSRGLLIKASDGTIRNCTFRNIAKVGVAIIYEIYWGESGVSENITVDKCVFDHTSYAHDGPSIEDESRSYKYVPIAVMGLGGRSLDEDFLLYRNITITSNKFVNRCLDRSNYAIYLRAVKGVKIAGNDFGMADDEDGMSKIALPLYVSGAMNVEISDNTYSIYFGDGYKNYIHGQKYKNVFGSDVEIDGVSQIPDSL